MKTLITIAMLCIVTLTSVHVAPKEKADDTLVNAYRLTYFRTYPLEDLHAYLDDIDCVNHFLTLHPNYVRNGKVMVSPDVVLTTCDW